MVNHTALVEKSAAQMFDLIEAAEDYPRFLPWCAGATIVARDATMVSADIRVDFHGVRFAFRTRNEKRRPEWMSIHLAHGPFRRFEGEWRLTALGADACKIEFRLDHEFDSALMTRLAGPVFDRISNTLVEAFVRRAESLPATTDAAAAAVPPAPPARGAP
jgi:ribosome-associated toxin RatA of RatAB toxin-antitoxin module